MKIEAVPFETAMHRILNAVRLRYEVENGKVVLHWAKISYFSSRKSLQYIVLDLAKQVGLGYNFDQSLKQTDPQCRLFLNQVSVENQPFDKAMASILDPKGLRYRVESGKVVLYRR